MWAEKRNKIHQNFPAAEKSVVYVCLGLLISRCLRDGTCVNIFISTGYAYKKELSPDSADSLISTLNVLS